AQLLEHLQNAHMGSPPRAPAAQYQADALTGKVRWGSQDRLGKEWCANHQNQQNQQGLKGPDAAKENERAVHGREVSHSQ
ncbi:MAG: hypothetical protein ACOYMG_26500, partial [Candidatus Methylumidiphilus sp.]